jgi:hypothetical protein
MLFDMHNKKADFFIERYSIYRQVNEILRKQAFNITITIIIIISIGFC